MRTAFVLSIAAALAAAATTDAAAQAPAARHHHTVVPAAALTWGPAPPSLPPGAQATALLGSPAKAGPFVIRLKLPAGFVIPPHRHSKDELVTVISGKFAVASGVRVDRASLEPLPAGSFFHLPAGMAHFARADGETVVQISGVSPFDVIYIDPGHDPRKKIARE